MIKHKKANVTVQMTLAVFMSVKECLDCIL